ncbi:MAG TPA: hypothetical protein HPP54_10705 [Nitrospinae bacterium]|nr:hypothetical protein [Nitrospinota bacterium]
METPILIHHGSIMEASWKHHGRSWKHHGSIMEDQKQKNNTNISKAT